MGHLRIVAELWGVELSAPDARLGIQQLALILLDAELAEEGLPTHIILLGRGKAHGISRDGTGQNGDLPALRVVSQFMAVEGQCRLQPKGIPGTQPDGPGPLGQEIVPEPESRFLTRKDLKADGFPGISGPGHHDLFPGHGDRADGISKGLRKGTGTQHLFQDLPGHGPLKGQHGDLTGPIQHLNPGKIPQVLPEVIPVLAPVCGIDHQEVFPG